MIKAAALLLTLFAAVPSFAAELELRYAALQRIIAEQVFTQEGRHYVRGDKTTRCQYAYLESPRIGADGDRLHVTAKFSGRSALDVFSRCVGMGDSFDLMVTAAPIARGGGIAFKDVKVTSVKDSYYIRRVRAALQQSFSKDFKIEVRDQARALLEQSRDGGAFKQELAAFDLGDVRVTPEALVLVVEFRLVVK
jgi:hypothetical protein